MAAVWGMGPPLLQLGLFIVPAGIVLDGLLPLSRAYRGLSSLLIRLPASRRSFHSELVALQSAGLWAAALVDHWALYTGNQPRKITIAVDNSAALQIAAGHANPLDSGIFVNTIVDALAGAATLLHNLRPTGLGYGLYRRNLREVLGKISPTKCLIIGVDANADFHASDDQGILIGTLLASGEPARNDHMLLETRLGLARLPLGFSLPGDYGLQAALVEYICGTRHYPFEVGITPKRRKEGAQRVTEAQVQDAAHKWWRNHHLPCLAAMPTLSDAEFAVRRQAGRKAPGPDSIPNEVWKLFPTYSGMWFWRLCTCIALVCKEPLEFKRALVCALYKKGPAALPENYRSIALLNGMAKVWHGHVRRTLGQSVLSRYGPLQLGGRAGVPVSFAVAAFRAAVDLCRAEGRCYAALFVDIQAAYYEASRDLIFRGDEKGETPEEPHLRHLAPLVQSLLKEGALELLGVPPDEIGRDRETASQTFCLEPFLPLLSVTSTPCVEMKALLAITGTGAVAVRGSLLSGPSTLALPTGRVGACEIYAHEPRLAVAT
ncbi:unnamed protein product [Symbiodinium microadriaticum]|nr:unnamed protein product [Symbiodinium microadriaticum]